MRFQTGNNKSYGNPLFSQTPRPAWVVRHPRWTVLALLFLTCGILYVLYGLPYWRITTLTVQGTYTLPVNDLRDLTLRQMQGRWLFAFRQNTLLAFDTSAYERRLRERWIFSELQVHRDAPGTIALTLVEEKPAFIFSQGTQKFGVDRNGVLSTVVHQPPPNVPTLRLEAQRTEQPLGASILPHDDAAFFLAWHSALAGRQIPTLALADIFVVASPDQTAKLRVAGEWEIITDRTQPVQKQIDAFFAAYDQKLQGRNIEYVDVTVPARVYYK